MVLTSLTDAPLALHTIFTPQRLVGIDPSNIFSLYLMAKIFKNLFSQVLVGIYIPDSLSATEYDHVIIGIHVNQNQDLQDTAFTNELANKLGALYVEAKGRKNARRKRRSGSTSATVSHKLIY